MDQENVCPECGSRHHQDFVRCPTCHAYIVDASPWRGDFNLIILPVTLFLWWGLDWVLRIPELPTSDIFKDAISRTILGLAIYGIVIVVLKWRLLVRQVKAFRQIRLVCALMPSSLDDSVLTAARDAISRAKLGPYNNFIAFHRLRWLVSASLVDKNDRQGLLEALRQHSESDWDSLESSFSFTQFLVWLLPSAGFLGTVWGMTQALQKFSITVGSQSDLSFTAGLMQTAQGLGTAFHTTLVGLAAVIPLLALTTTLRRRSQNLLEQMDKYFLRVAAQVLYHGDDAESLIQATDDELPSQALSAPVPPTPPIPTVVGPALVNPDGEAPPEPEATTEDLAADAESAKPLPVVSDDVDEPLPVASDDADEPLPEVSENAEPASPPAPFTPIVPSAEAPEPADDEEPLDRRPPHELPSEGIK